MPALQKNFDSIDIMKFIASIAIVAIHADALYDIDVNLNHFICHGLFRIAVPLFFFASAYFFFKKDLNEKNIYNFCKRLAVLYIYWFIITLPITVFNRFYCSKYSFSVTLFRFLRGFIFSSTFGGSWYLMSCFFCGILFYYLNKIKYNQLKLTIIVIISVYSYFLPVLCSTYGTVINNFSELQKIYKIYEMFFAKPYNSIIVGIPYFAIMFYYHNNLNSIRKDWKLYMISIIFVVLFISEILIVNIYDLKKASDCYVFLLPVSVCLFIFTLCSNINFVNSKQLRKCSTIIYFSHFIWLFMLEFLEWATKIRLSNLIKFILAVIMSVICAFILLYLENNSKLKWIKYLY